MTDFTIIEMVFTVMIGGIYTLGIWWTKSIIQLDKQMAWIFQKDKKFNTLVAEVK